MSEAAGALGGAASGAATGFAIGGPWGAAIGGAVGLVSSLFGSSSAKKANRDALKAAIEAAQARNKALLTETARGAAEVNRQRTLSSIQTLQALQHTKKEATLSTANANVQLAAVEAIGNSTAAIMSDIDHQVNEADAATLFNAETVNENLNMSLVNLVNSSISQVQPVGGQYQQVGSSWSQALLQTAQAATSIYSGTKGRTGGTSSGQYSLASGMKAPGGINPSSHLGFRL